MTHDRFVRIRTILGSIGVGKTVKGVTVSCFDGIKPGLLDWKAKTGMVKSNKGSNAGEIQAAWIEESTCSSCCEGNSLGNAIDVVPKQATPEELVARIPWLGWG